MKTSKFTVAMYVALLSFMLAVAVQTALANTVPNPPDTVTTGPGFRGEQVGGIPIQAIAGNVTALVVTDSSQSQFWQGYYGNVTGRIVLDDAQNSTLFAWELAAPSGEIYAVNTSNVVSWANITCVNFTALNNTDSGKGSGKINLSTLSVQFNMNTSRTLENLSKEGFNYTFNTTFAGGLTVGTRTIAAGDNCPQAFMFVNELYQTTDFREVLLFDNQSALVFAAILENSKDGYQAGNDDLSDFQMIVPEDGSPGKESTTATYYFYVELQ